MAEESEHTAAVRVAGAAPTEHDSSSSAPPSAMLRAAPRVGARIGRYVVEHTIGQGGMGIVVAARHEQLGEMVAIKLLHPKAEKDAIQVERFVREARAAVRIKSEHVVRVLDAGADPSTGAPFIVMEHLEGRDIGELLAADGPMPMQMAVDCTIQICEAVGAAHALGIIHRDLKPSNFFFVQRADGSPLVKVLDFGIAKAAQADGSPDPRLTETQAVFGSPTYMSPEQIRSSKNVDPRSDVWSLGIALFEMMTGMLPFEADNVAGLLASVIADPPLRVARFLPQVPPELEATVLRCLEKDPARRIGSVAELAVRLAPFASEESARLASRVDRRASGSYGGSPSASPSAPSLPPAFAPLAPAAPFAPLAPLGHASGPVAFGATGTDLSATGFTGPQGERASPRGQTLRAVALVAGGLALLGALGGGVYAARARRVAQVAAAAPAPAPAPATSLTPATSGVVSGLQIALPAPPSAAPPGAAATPAAEAPPTAEAPPAAEAPTSAPPGRLRKTTPGHARTAPRASAVPPVAASHTAPAPPHGTSSPAPPAPSTNLDSRF